ncbi:unnamed protein product [Brassicogethes aeneus]|uniref:PIN domain-containing protein n=1 Tax=Brassicogethes aeneus TaxID=1431903 RepID=A0A9P0ARQ9_BRAAE|nr:unnamed protein product [Brassicogethes aeneus]
MSYNERPKLQASRNRFNQDRRQHYNEYNNYNNNYYKYGFREHRQGVKRPHDRYNNHTNAKRYKPYEELPRSSCSSNKVVNENKTDKPQPCKSTYIKTKHLETSETTNKKNIASNRMVQLRKSLELKKPDNPTNHSNNNKKETTSQINKKVETVQREVFIIKNKTPQKSASDRLKDIRNSASKSITSKSKTECLLLNSNVKTNNISQSNHTHESKPKTLVDRLKVNNNSNATTSKNLEAPGVFNLKSRVHDQSIIDLTNSPVKPNHMPVMLNNEMETENIMSPDRLKDIRNSASKSITAKSKTECLLLNSNVKTNNISQSNHTHESKPKTLADRLKVNNNSNATTSKNLEAPGVFNLKSRVHDQSIIDLTNSLVKPNHMPVMLNNEMETENIMSPVKLENKIDKNGFTNGWIAYTNFDGDSSSFMEVSTQARANDTVANLDTVTCDMAEMEWTSEISSKKMFQGKTNKDHNVCIVVDTNIFMHNLEKIKDILNVKVSGATIPIVYIPWMVVNELDNIKDCSHDQNAKKSAFYATKFIHEILKRKHPRLHCQNVFDVDKQKEMGKAPDDKIMSSCLQALETYENVYLFSNDINLKNKAMIHNIPALSENEVIIRIMAKLNKAVKVQAVMSKMSMLCSYIIIESVKQCYGPVWSKMDMLTEDQPWPFVKCLKIFKRYWAAVFRDKYLKHFINTIDQTLTFIKKLAHICDDSKEYSEFVILCVELCVFLKDFNEHRDIVKKTIQDITNV